MITAHARAHFNKRNTCFATLYLQLHSVLADPPTKTDCGLLAQGVATTLIKPPSSSRGREPAFRRFYYIGVVHQARCTYDVTSATADAKNFVR